MAITAQEVKKLREITGAGMMDCKKALTEADGDFDKAIEFLRKKGQKLSEKRADRETTEGNVFIKTNDDETQAFLISLTCETDFVSKNEDFQNFNKDIAMHIAALNPQFVSVDEIDEDTRKREADVLKAKAIEEGKNPDFLEKIIEGQLKKWAAGICLMDQPFVKNGDQTVSEYLNATIAKIGENIVIRRFVRFELGEGIEKKADNFAEEVAATLAN